MEIHVGAGNRLPSGSALLKFIGEQQAVDIPAEYMTIGGKKIPLREAVYHGSAPEITDDYPVFGSGASSEKDDLPF